MKTTLNSRKFSLAIIAVVMIIALLPLTARGHAEQPHTPAGPPFNLFLPLILAPDIDVSAVLTPFDANLNDLVGPSSWSSIYGKTPEIIVASNGVEISILAQDYDSGTPWNAVLLQIEPSPSGYKITQALTDIPMLDRVMGLAIDASGNRYYATGVDE